MLRPEIAAKNAQYVGYATPNKDALALLPEDITSDESFYPSEEAMEKMEVYENLGTDLLSLYNDLFLEPRSLETKKSRDTLSAFFLQKKKKKNE